MESERSYCTITDTGYFRPFLGFPLYAAWIHKGRHGEEELSLHSSLPFPFISLRSRSWCYEGECMKKTTMKEKKKRAHSSWIVYANVVNLPPSPRRGLRRGRPHVEKLFNFRWPLYRIEGLHGESHLWVSSFLWECQDFGSAGWKNSLLSQRAWEDTENLDEAMCWNEQGWMKHDVSVSWGYRWKTVRWKGWYRNIMDAIEKHDWRGDTL